MIYEYPDFHDGWVIDSIKTDILESSMTDKNIEWGRWDEDLELLSLMFTDELSPADKIILDQIVEDHR